MDEQQYCSTEYCIKQWKNCKNKEYNGGDCGKGKEMKRHD
jgi:hypothetical protein